MFACCVIENLFSSRDCGVCDIGRTRTVRELTQTRSQGECLADKKMGVLSSKMLGT